MSPNSPKDPTDHPVEIRLKRINSIPLAMSCGLLAGLGIFIATNWLVLKRGDVVGPHLALLSEYLVGYRVSFLGSLIGFIEVFAFGFLVAYFVAALYNWLADRRGQVSVPEAQPRTRISAEASPGGDSTEHNRQPELSRTDVEINNGLEREGVHQ
jgi:hypothetical protein